MTSGEFSLLERQINSGMGAQALRLTLDGLTPDARRAALYAGISKRPRRYQCSPTFFVLCLAVFCPMALAPSHPLAVYGYLADAGMAYLHDTSGASSDELTNFLTSPGQVACYQEDLREDLWDARTGRMFAIVRAPDGKLLQARIRTWNGFLPERTPQLLLSWADMKEIPFVGDEVELWAQGYSIEARGHYHAFGGAPSPGDQIAQRLSPTPEIVVANGLIPSIYLNGKLVLYGHVEAVPIHIFKRMRALEGDLSIELGQETPIPAQPSESLKSFLGFLQEYHGTDINEVDAISEGIRRLAANYRSAYGGAFSKDFSLGQAAGDPDLHNLLKRLDDLELWAVFYMRPPSGRTETWSVREM